MATVFSLSGLLVLPFWLLMILAPTWTVTRRIVASPWIAAPPALVYAALVVPNLASLWPRIANADLAGIAALLGTPEGATIAWAHFLAFDLLVGRQVYLEARESGRSPFLMAPVLFLTFMFGPLGFLLHLALRAWPARGRSGSARLA